MAISIVQTTRSQTNGASTTASIATAPTSGNILIAIAYTNGNQTTLDVTGFTTAVKTNYSGTAASIGIFYKVSDGTESSVTSTGMSICRLHVLEATGLTVPATLDGVNSNTQNTTTTINTGVITTSIPDNLIITGGANVASSSGTRVWSDSFSVLLDDMTGPRLLSGYRIVSSTGNYSSTATLNVANSNSGAVIAAFSASSAPVGLQFKVKSAGIFYDAGLAVKDSGVFVPAIPKVKAGGGF